MIYILRIFDARQKTLGFVRKHSRDTYTVRMVYIKTIIRTAHVLSVYYYWKSILRPPRAPSYYDAFLSYTYIYQQRALYNYKV